jgi:uncharacterized membrane protein
VTIYQAVGILMLFAGVLIAGWQPRKESTTNNNYGVGIFAIACGFCLMAFA